MTTPSPVVSCCGAPPPAAPFCRSPASWPPAAAERRRGRRHTGDRRRQQGAREHAPLLELDALHRRRREDEEAGTLAAVPEKTGVKVAYFEDINDNATYFGKIQGPLSQGQSIDRDIIVLTDNSRFPGLLINKGWAEKLDKSAIPNIKNLQAALQHPSFDPNREYSLPWQSGMTGIATNKNVTGGKLSRRSTQLLEDPKLQGQGDAAHGDGRHDEPRHARERRRPDEGRRGVVRRRRYDRIKKAVDSGQIRQFTGNDYTGPLAKGDLVGCFSWSGDVVQLDGRQPEPRAGTSRTRAATSGPTTC